MVIHQTGFQSSTEASERTQLSVDFEAFWRALPRADLVPARDDFRPERAAKFLRHVLLCEAKFGVSPELLVRLVGTEFERLVQRDVRGQNYLEFLPPQHRGPAMESTAEIVKRPCGLWQIMPIHYERGFAHYLEITVFPLQPAAGGNDLLLILTQPLSAYLSPAPTGDKAMCTDTALTFRYLDVGAGIPV